MLNCGSCIFSTVFVDYMAHLIQIVYISSGYSAQPDFAPFQNFCAVIKERLCDPKDSPWVPLLVCIPLAENYWSTKYTLSTWMCMETCTVYKNYSYHIIVFIKGIHDRHLVITGQFPKYNILWFELRDDDRTAAKFSNLSTV